MLKLDMAVLPAALDTAFYYHRDCEYAATSTLANHQRWDENMRRVYVCQECGEIFPRYLARGLGGLRFRG